jgi:hypothetical protein
MLQLHAVLLKIEKLEPRPPYTTPANLLTVFDEAGGDVFTLTATEDAAAVLETAEPRAEIVLTLRPTEINLKAATNGALSGRAYRLRAIGAEIQSEGGRNR